MFTRKFPVNPDSVWLNYFPKIRRIIRMHRAREYAEFLNP